MAVLGGAIGFIEELISFLDCEERSECPEVNEWSMWSGSGKTGGSITSLIEKAKGFASQRWRWWRIQWSST